MKAPESGSHIEIGQETSRIGSSVMWAGRFPYPTGFRTCSTSIRKALSERRNKNDRRLAHRAGTEWRAILAYETLAHRLFSCHLFRLARAQKRRSEKPVASSASFSAVYARFRLKTLISVTSASDKIVQIAMFATRLVVFTRQMSTGPVIADSVWVAQSKGIP